MQEDSCLSDTPYFVSCGVISGVIKCGAEGNYQIVYANVNAQLEATASISIRYLDLL